MIKISYEEAERKFSGLMKYLAYTYCNSSNNPAYAFEDFLQEERLVVWKLVQRSYESFSEFEKILKTCLVNKVKDVYYKATRKIGNRVREDVSDLEVRISISEEVFGKSFIREYFAKSLIEQTLEIIRKVYPESYDDIANIISLALNPNKNFHGFVKTRRKTHTIRLTDIVDFLGISRVKLQQYLKIIRNAVEQAREVLCL